MSRYLLKFLERWGIYIFNYESVQVFDQSSVSNGADRLSEEPTQKHFYPGTEGAKIPKKQKISITRLPIPRLDPTLTTLKTSNDPDL